MKTKNNKGETTFRYGVIAAITLETKAQIGLECKQHTFIHFLAVRPKFETSHHLKYLMYNVIKQTNMQSTMVNFVTKVNGYSQ